MKQKAIVDKTAETQAWFALNLASRYAILKMQQGNRKRLPCYSISYYYI